MKKFLKNIVMKSKKYTVTVHGKERAKLRGGYDRKQDVVALFKNALNHGKSPAEFMPPFSDFLKSKLNRGCHVKVYSGMIFIYKGKTLITCYNIPDKYKVQLEYEKQKKSIRKQFSDVRNKDLRLQLIQGMKHLVSYCILANQSIVLLDTDLMRELEEMCLELKVLIDELWIRIGNEEVEEQHIPSMIFTQYLSITISQFEVLTSNMVGFGASKANKTGEMMHKDAQDYFELLSIMRKAIDMIEADKFYLNSDSVYEKIKSW